MTSRFVGLGVVVGIVAALVAGTDTAQVPEVPDCEDLPNQRAELVALRSATACLGDGGVDPRFRQLWITLVETGFLDSVRGEVYLRRVAPASVAPAGSTRPLGEDFVVSIAGNSDFGSMVFLHELAHVLVFSELADRRSPGDGSACEGYSWRQHCFEPDSLIERWHLAFWADEPVPSDTMLCKPISFVSLRASADPSEDLAESIVAYITDSDQLTIAKFSFLQRNGINQSPATRDLVDRKLIAAYFKLGQPAACS